MDYRKIQQENQVVDGVACPFFEFGMSASVAAMDGSEIVSVPHLVSRRTSELRAIGNPLSLHFDETSPAHSCDSTCRVSR